jgi:hypothetical protein
MNVQVSPRQRWDTAGQAIGRTPRSGGFESLPARSISTGQRICLASITAGFLCWRLSLLERRPYRLVHHPDMRHWASPLEPHAPLSVGRSRRGMNHQDHLPSSLRRPGPPPMSVVRCPDSHFGQSCRTVTIRLRRRRPGNACGRLTGCEGIGLSLLRAPTVNRKVVRWRGTSASAHGECLRRHRSRCPWRVPHQRLVHRRPALRRRHCGWWRRSRP